MARTKKRSLSASFNVILYVIVVVLTMSLFAGGFLIYDFIFAKPDDGRPSVQLFRGDRRVRTLNQSEVMMSGEQVLIDITVLSEHCAYGIAGDSIEKTLVFSNGDYATFAPGSAFCLNGENSFLSTDCVLSGERFYVPLSFYEDYIKGLKFSTNESGSRLYIDVAASKYSLLSFSSSPEDSLSASDYFDAVSSGRTAPEFKTDLSQYEQYMDPVERDKYLFLVNRENHLDREYLPQNLTDLIHTRKDGRSTQQMELYAAKAMEAMLKEAAAHGYTSLSITSAYRSYNYQQVLFDNQVSALRGTYGERAREKAAEAVAIPGTSEHQSGLCADLHNLPAASQKFANTDEYRWLLENCAKFGFILRYPKNKTDKTNIMFEPWHYRFVGRYHAERIMQEGLCLEEYMEMLD